MKDVSLGVVALLQARMSSSRLPGKVLLPCGESTFLGQQIMRIRSSRLISKIIVLTSTHESDDSIANYCNNLNIPVFRGNLHDVYQRFYDYLNSLSQEMKYFVRLTADCPFACGDLIDEVVRIALDSDCDYASNTLLPTFPDGMDVEVVKIASFLKLNDYKLNSYEREHVTPGLYFRPEIFSLANLSTSPNFSNFRLTLDTKWDADFLSRISDLYPNLVAVPTYSKIRDLITSDEENFPQTQIRNAISKGPWVEYSYPHE